MKKEILKLQKLMKREGIDIYFIPSGDDHSSEYVHDHYKAREFMSGLTGESGELVVTCFGAWLFTDARFFLQAETQLKGSEIVLMKSGEENVPTPCEFMKELIRKYNLQTLGFDSSTISYNHAKSILDNIKGISIKDDIDLVDEVWIDRPILKPTKIYSLPFNSVGISPLEKIAIVREQMKEKGATFLLVSDLTEIAWLFNLRGGDVKYIPVFFSFCLISLDKVNLYVKNKNIEVNEKENDISFVSIKDYDAVYSDLEKIAKENTIWFDSRYTNLRLYNKIPRGVSLITSPTPIELLKAVKNDVELKNTVNAHIKDAIAMEKFIFTIKNLVKTKRLTELDASKMLYDFRKEMDGFISLSFESIVGYASNGAIVHYAPTKETNKKLEPAGLLLADSGGQYIDGTTDITRTIALGPLTDEMKKVYTIVLKGHIAMAIASLSSSALGDEIDKIARKPIRDAGYDFKHGLGHGVGHVLACHEGPNILRRNASPCPLLNHMIITDEPGIYLDNKFGVRIENELLITDTGDSKFFSAITMVPFEREAIDSSLLTVNELEYINAYHEEVRDTLLPYTTGKLRDFLVYQTEPIL